MPEFDTEFIGENWIESQQLIELKKGLDEENERLVQKVVDAKTKDEVIIAQSDIDSFSDEYAALMRDIDQAELVISPLWENATLISADFFYRVHGKVDG